MPARFADPSSLTPHALLVALALSIFWFVDRFEVWTCPDEDKRLAFNAPEFSPNETKMGRAARPPARREMVLFRTSGRDVLARVVALEGDTVELDREGLKVNDKKDPGELSLKLRRTDIDVPRTLVPRGCMFVLVDQRSRSESALQDSRTLGPIPLDSIELVFPEAKKGTDNP